MKYFKILCALYFFVLLFVNSIYGQQNTITIHMQNGKDTISKHIYGHFAEHLGRGIYDGFYVGKDSEIENINGIRKDVVEALKELDIPVIRWPGGCFAEQYHWMDGVGAVENRPKVVNIFWGGEAEDNSFGTHEFLELCELLDTEPYIAVNIASGTVKEASQWIEYVTSDVDSDITALRKQNGREKPWDVKFWGIGNENWGCGGSMNAEYYTNVFKRYSTYCNGEYKIASGGVFDDLSWTETFMKGIQEVPDFIHMVDGLSYHYYTICNNWSEKGSATKFDKSEWFRSMNNTLKMEANIKEHIGIMDKYDPENKIALIADEWGTWYDVEPGTNPSFLFQQNSLRDALVAALGLNIFNNNARRIKMANIAQTVNVLQAMILTDGEQMIKTPSYYVFKMYKVHQNALLLPSQVSSERFFHEDVSIPSLSVSASKQNNDRTNVTIVNVNPEKEINTTIQLKLEETQLIDLVAAEVITSHQMNAINDFGKTPEVTSTKFSDFKIKHKTIEIDIPSKSIVLLSIKTK